MADLGIPSPRILTRETFEAAERSLSCSGAAGCVSGTAGAAAPGRKERERASNQAFCSAG